VAYAAGKYAKAMCDICGFEVKYSDLQPQWDGFRACPECWTPRHPQDFPKIVITDAEALRNPRPDNDLEAGNGTIYVYAANDATPVGSTFTGFKAEGSVGTVTVSIS